MSRSDHGQSLSALLEQPGATFRISTAGSDTGTRIYVCDRSVAASLAPAKGSADSEFPLMYVEDVDISFDVADLARLTVSYKGNIKDPSTNPEPQTGLVYRMNAQIDFYNVNDLRFVTKYQPTVSHTYSTNVFPSFQVGEYIDPPEFADKLPPTSFTANGENYLITRVQTGWKLHNRDVELTGQNHNIVDTYLYDYKVQRIDVFLSDGSGIFSTYDPVA